MRWENLSLDREDEGAEATLPGFRDPARVRTFDAPEALGTRFYEVGARSILNRVPERSRMPFRWTINPYRGCSHACSYCASGDTLVLMADGRTKQLADVRAGDWVYGTVRRGSYRRYEPTEVLDHWGSRKHAYEVTLEDGTTLRASGDHRFLTSRGWKHVAGSQRGYWRRPHLTLNDKLIGTGSFVEGPRENEDYRRGYLSGMVRGDGHLSCPPRGAGQPQFRLALIDLEALARSRRYLELEAVTTTDFLFQVAGAIGASKEVRAIRTQRRDAVTRVGEVVAWPRASSDDWCKGFLAGIFDAEGSNSGVIRISNTDPAIIDWISWCLLRFGFRYTIEDPKRGNGLRCVRLLGGLRERLRFLLTTDPAISRKREMTGTALKSDAKLRVVDRVRLGRQDLYDITTGTGDFIANGVVSHNCFARPTHTFLDFDAGRDFEREIVVKTNAPERLRAELAKPSWKREHVALGTNTDPYQWVEGRYRLMVGIWEAMRDFANPCSVLTKSPLLLRDLDLMKQIAARTEFHANLSIPTLDERAWRETEPHTPNPRKRLEAVAALNEAGIPTGILIAPLMPGINDSPAQVEEILRLAAEAGATNVGGIGLHLRGETRDVFFDWLAEFRPDLVELYERLYSRGAYLPKPERERLAKLARGRHPPRRFLREPMRSSGGRGRARGTAVPPESSQPGLF